MGSIFLFAVVVGFLPMAINFLVLPLFHKGSKTEVDPVLPSELDDWDAEFTRLTGKSIWQARCEANPELRKSAMELGTTQNNPNPFRAVDSSQFSAALQQQNRHHQQALAAQMNTQQKDQSQLSGLLGGLGNIGGLFH